MSDKEANELADQCVAKMLQVDNMANSHGMQPVSQGPGAAEVSMKITDNMLNGHATCHGGMIFALADTAFAYASNNCNEANVAMDCRIDFLYPAYDGDELTAIAKRTHRGRKSSLFEVVVKNQEDRNIAFFQGRSYYINRTVLDDYDDE